MIIPVDDIEGLESASITEVLIHGEDEEDTEAFRARYAEYVSQPSQDGNVNQYKVWAQEYSGVGRAQILPLWDGGNTVKVVITDSNFGVPSSTLVSNLQTYLDPGASGLGNGKAPIGSVVTVVGGTQLSISIAATVVYADGYKIGRAHV